jgi:hypothetical protein
MRKVNDDRLDVAQLSAVESNAAKEDQNVKANEAK